MLYDNAPSTASRRSSPQLPGLRYVNMVDWPLADLSLHTLWKLLPQITLLDNLAQGSKVKKRYLKGRTFQGLRDYHQKNLGKGPTSFWAMLHSFLHRLLALSSEPQIPISSCRFCIFTSFFKLKWIKSNSSKFPQANCDFTVPPNNAKSISLQ